MTTVHTPPQTGATRWPANSGNFCWDHGTYDPCPDHDCSYCFVADYGYGECPYCDDVTTPWVPPGLCPRGEDCPICPDCPIAPNGAATCSCTTTLCPQCDRCPRHAVDYCAGCYDRYSGEGKAYCARHGWVTLCFAHGDCADRYEEDGYGCLFKPYSAASPSCRYCQGVGPCKYCHPHCPGCWAHNVLVSRGRPGLVPAPPPCSWCEDLVTAELLAVVRDGVECLTDPERWLAHRRCSS